MALFNLSNITTLEDLKKQYYKLAKIYHPDAGGTNEQMKALNSEYELLFDKLSRGGNLSEDEINLEYQINEVYKEIIDKIIQYPGLEIEIIGTWIWVSGNTYPIRQILKEIGFKFAPKKKRWYWHAGEFRKRSKTDLSIEDIRNLYGSQKVDSKGQRAITGLASLAGNLQGLQHLLNHKAKINGIGAINDNTADNICKGIIGVSIISLLIKAFK